MELRYFGTPTTSGIQLLGEEALEAGRNTQGNRHQIRETTGSAGLTRRQTIPRDFSHLIGLTSSYDTITNQFNGPNGHQVSLVWLCINTSRHHLSPLFMPLPREILMGRAIARPLSLAR